MRQNKASVNETKIIEANIVGPTKLPVVHVNNK